MLCKGLNAIRPAGRFGVCVAVLLLGATSVKGQMETVKLKNGKTYEVKTKQGLPVGFESDQLKVTNLIFSGSTEKSPKMEFVWVLTAELREKGKFAVTVTTPLDETVSTTFQCKGPGRISRSFFGSTEYPALWAWIDEPGTTWIPFVFSFADKGSGKKFEATQWVMFDSATMREWREPMKRAEEFLKKKPDKQ